MKTRIVAALTTIMMAMGTLAVPVNAAWYLSSIAKQNYTLYDASTDKCFHINIYDYPGETIETFCAKRGYEVAYCAEDENWFSDYNTFFAEHPTAEFENPGYTEGDHSNDKYRPEVDWDRYYADKAAKEKAAASAETTTTASKLTAEQAVQQAFALYVQNGYGTEDAFARVQKNVSAYCARPDNYAVIVQADIARK